MISRLFIKLFLILTGVLLLYALSILLIITPKVQEQTVSLEERNGKVELEKIVLLVDNFGKNMEQYREITLSAHKAELKNLADVAETLVYDIYRSSTPEQVSQELKSKAEEFVKLLELQYKRESVQSGRNAAIAECISIINDYRFNNGAGYFYALYDDTRVITHPIIPEMIGKHYTELKGMDGKPIEDIPLLVNKSLTEGEAFITYDWPNPVSGNIETKLVYGIKFEPLNWVIVTGVYLPDVVRNRQKMALANINSLTYGNDDYYFITDFNSVFLSHPYLTGQDFSEEVDIRGNLIVPNAVNNALKNGDGYTSYWWRKNTEDDTQYEKLLYSRVFVPWSWVISTGVYIDEIDDEINIRYQQLKDLLDNIIKDFRIGKDGYIFIFDKYGNIILHPDPELSGQNIKDNLNPGKETTLFNDLIEAYENGNRKLLYKWEKIDNSKSALFDKIAWIDFNPYFEWYICSSVYIDELYESSYSIRNYIILITVVIIAAGFISGFISFNRLLLPVTKLAAIAKQIKEGNFSIRSGIDRNDELGLLAKAFDEMLDKVMEDVNLLDQKVNDKTKELSLINNELVFIIDELKKTQEQLVESEKMSALGGLVAGVAHEVNTPVGMALTGITHILDEEKIILKKYEIGEMTEDDFTDFLSLTRELGKSIEFNLNRAANLVRSFKQVAVDQSSEEIRVFNLKDYTEEILTSIHNKIKKTKHTIEINTDPDIKVRSYPGALSQIITNLIFNSLIHGFDESTAGLITINMQKKEDEIELIYQDNGKGISEENLKKIFNPFFTTNRDHGGSGLGMNIIYNLVTSKLHGKIRCESKERNGVTFTITFPAELKEKGAGNE